MRAALAGGIASGTTTLVMYPLDTLKTRVQSTAGATIGSIVRSVPDIGLRGLYRHVHILIKNPDKSDMQLSSSHRYKDTLIVLVVLITSLTTAIITAAEKAGEHHTLS